MKQTKLLFLLLLLMAIPATMRAYVEGEIVRKDGYIYQVIDMTKYELSFVGVENSVYGAISVPATVNPEAGTTFKVTKDRWK